MQTQIKYVKLARQNVKLAQALLLALVVIQQAHYQTYTMVIVLQHVQADTITALMFVLYVILLLVRLARSHLQIVLLVML